MANKNKNKQETLVKTPAHYKSSWKIIFNISYTIVYGICSHCRLFGLSSAVTINDTSVNILVCTTELTEFFFLSIPVTTINETKVGIFCEAFTAFTDLS